MREVTGNITESQIRELVSAFYSKIDNHAPLEDFYSVLAIEDSGFKIVLPGVVLADKATMESWYNRMIHGYFDGSHEVYSVDVVSASPS